MFTTLNNVWALAICRGVSAASRAMPSRSAACGETAATRPASWLMNGSQTTTPSVLNSTCTTAARVASRGLPIEASRAVTQVPTLAPNARAIPAGSVIRP